MSWERKIALGRAAVDYHDISEKIQQMFIRYYLFAFFIVTLIIIHCLLIFLLFFFFYMS